MRGITKRFPGVVANDRVDFEAAAGEVHALLGENGAGKSTLSNILTGLYRPDEGQIFLNGRLVHFQVPRDALDAGTWMEQQNVTGRPRSPERGPRRPPPGRVPVRHRLIDGASPSCRSVTACGSIRAPASAALARRAAASRILKALYREARI
jgi:energy-coupling factor transporter ATP-binding protein EcfA2